MAIDVTQLPTYFQPSTDPSSPTSAETIAARLLQQVPSTWDRSTQNTLLQLWANGNGLELSQLPAALQRALDDCFMFTTKDTARAIQRLAEQGLVPLNATFAVTTLGVTAPAGTTIPSNTRVSTPLVGGVGGILFVTQASGTVAIGQTTVSVPIIAFQAGSAGNVAANTIAVLVDQIAGVAAITNPDAATGGFDAETIAGMQTRYAEAIQDPRTGENLGTYRRWAEDVAGVGSARAVRAWNGPGTIGVYLLGEDGLPAPPSIIQAVEDSIIDPWRVIVAANTLAIGGHGVATDGTQPDAHAIPALAFTYSALGNGTATLARLDLVLPQEGIWRIRPRLKRGSSAGTGNLFQFTVNDLTTATIAAAAPSGGTAQETLTAAQMTTAFQGADAGTDPYGFDVFWNGIDQLQLVATRLTTDTTTEVWLDQILLQSTISRDDRDVGLQSAADRVTVLPNPQHNLSVVVTLEPPSGADVPTVRSNAQVAVVAYLAALYASGATVLPISGIAGAIQSVTPFTYTSLQVDGGQTDITLAAHTVPILTTWTPS